MANFVVSKLVGQRLKALRLKVGLTEAEICKKLQMNEGNFSKLENGTASIPFWRLMEIVQFFNVDTGDVLWGEGNSGVPELQEEVESLARINLLQAEEIARLQRKVVELYCILEPNCRSIRA